MYGGQIDQAPLRNSRPGESPHGTHRRKPPLRGKREAEDKGQKMISLSGGGSPALWGELHLRRDEISERSLQRNSRALSARFPPGSPPNGGITRDTAVSSISWTFTLRTCSPAAHNLARPPPPSRLRSQTISRDLVMETVSLNHPFSLFCLRRLQSPRR